jgi:hypothetical protein
VAGIESNEGAVIVKDRIGVAHLEELTDEKWFIFLANEDWYKGECRERCQRGNQMMVAMG